MTAQKEPDNQDMNLSLFSSFIGLIAGIVLAGGLGPGRARADEGTISPTITFSKDQRRVSIEYKGRAWEFVRPVVSPWNFRTQDTTYWVSPEGDDQTDGTQARPFRTIGAGVERARPGDIVFVRAGRYRESLLIRKSGQEGRPIILSCAPGDLGKVTITPTSDYVARNPSGAVIMLHGARHVWINGLVIEGPLGRPEAPRAETYGANGITWAGKAGEGCRATNCVVYGNVHCGLKEMGHGGTGILMQSNVIFGNGTRSTDHGIYVPADDLTIDGNILFANAGYGIHSYSQPQRQRITRNLCVENKVCGIILAGSHNEVYHNVCVGNPIGIFYFRGGSTDNVVEDNIFAFNERDSGYDNGGGSLGDPARNQDDFNDYFPGTPDARIAPGEHEIHADPRFVDRAKGDFRLRDDSPCRGRGKNVSLPFQGPSTDLGAFPCAGDGDRTG